jgi:hypothetical protein
MQRVTASAYWATFAGYVVILFAALFVVSAVVGLAVVFDVIAGWVR